MDNKIVLCDIDGTLAGVSHRLHFIEKSPKDWEAFYDACVDDVPYRHIVHLIQRLSKHGHEIWMLSGRRFTCLSKTLLWFYQHEIPFNEVRLRKTGDTREDWIVKEEFLLQLLSVPSASKESILFALEDRSQCVEMYRRHGIPCLQVEEGNY